jgi:hypothetical protein
LKSDQRGGTPESGSGVRLPIGAGSAEDRNSRADRQLHHRHLARADAGFVANHQLQLARFT